MRVVFIHSPPWQIPDESEDPAFLPYGPAAGYGSPGILDPDFLSIPYGLLCLAAQAREAGHDVDVYNISNWLWGSVEYFLSLLEADVFALNCLTANRRGVAAVADSIKRHHPHAHVTVGGPHAAALPLEMLRHHPSLDSVCAGEGELALLELLDQLEKSQTLEGVSGMAVRHAGIPVLGPARARVADLDSLACPHDHFVTDTIITARGCPGHCSFCASDVLWGGKVRFHSVERVVHMFQRCVENGVNTIAVKDDTFTASKKRAIAICRKLRSEGIDALWSCDTRVDHVDAELLYEMRKAGCCRLSYGVESGSPEILQGMGKRITPEDVLSATKLARRFGFEIRWYMVAGGRGETAETFQASLDLVQRGQPDSASFCMLSAYPGTREFELLKQGGLTEDVFFENDFTTLEIFWGESGCRKTIRQFVSEKTPLRYGGYSVAQRRRIADLFPDMHCAHFDLAIALAHEQRFVEALSYAEKAVSEGFPDKARALNFKGCLMAAAGSITSALSLLKKAEGECGGEIATKNIAILQKAIEKSEERFSLELQHHAAFRVVTPHVQPSMPVPISWADVRPDFVA